MKKFVSLFAVLCIIFSMTGIAVYADADNAVDQEIIYFDDGSYIVKTIYQDNVPATRSANVVRTTSGHATVDAYNTFGKLILSLSVYGTFEYDGTTAEATAASCRYDIVQSGWTCTASNAYCSGPTAYATATFEAFLASDINGTVTLTCSPTGVLS